MTINKYKSRTHETMLYSNILFWQSCIYRWWTQILLPSQHSWASSAALFWWSSWPPCPPSPVSAVHHVTHCCSKTESDHGWERGIEAIIVWVHREDEATTQSWTRAGKRVWDNLAAAVSAPNICVLLSMSTTTCNTFTQSKTFYISCCQHSIHDRFHATPHWCWNLC